MLLVKLSIVCKVKKLFVLFTKNGRKFYFFKNILVQNIKKRNSCLNFSLNFCICVKTYNLLSRIRAALPVRLRR
mgnify:CR=1 FL=1